MAVDFAERRRGDRRAAHGPAHVVVLRGQLIEHHMEDQVDWADVAAAADKIANFARHRQQRAWQRVKSWDGGPDAA